MSPGPVEPPPEFPGRGEGLVRSPALNTAQFFFYLEMILIRVTTQHEFVCVRVGGKVVTGRVKNVGLQLRRSCLKCRQGRI